MIVWLRRVVWLAFIFVIFANENCYNYDQAKPIIIISLLKENHFHDRDDYIRSYSMRDDKTYELMKDNKIFFICIEARKCVKLGDKDKNHLIRWMHFFSNISQKNDAELAEKDEVIKLLLEAEKMWDCIDG